MIRLHMVIHIGKTSEFLTCALVEDEHTSLTSAALKVSSKKRLKAWCRKHNIPFRIQRLDPICRRGRGRKSKK